MVRAAPSLVLAVFAALVAALACGPGDARKDGAEGLGDAFHAIAEHECRCVAEANGLGSEIEDACREQVGDVEDFFPVSCIEGVIDRHPEARSAYDCAADVTYDYVECIVEEGCTGGGESETAEASQPCDAMLQSAVTQCPQPPHDVLDEIEACFRSTRCDDDRAVPEDLECDRARPNAASTSASIHPVKGERSSARQLQPAPSLRSSMRPGSVPGGSPVAPAVSDAPSPSVAALVPVAAPTLPAVAAVSSSLPPAPVVSATPCTSQLPTCVQPRRGSGSPAPPLASNQIAREPPKATGSNRTAHCTTI